jgi:hypothetical protein
MRDSFRHFVLIFGFSWIMVLVLKLIGLVSKENMLYFFLSHFSIGIVAYYVAIFLQQFQAKFKKNKGIFGA